MPDGSFFDTMWRIFLHQMAHFYAPRGSGRGVTFTFFCENQSKLHPRAVIGYSGFKKP
jgi:hypothetical protein